MAQPPDQTTSKYWIWAGGSGLYTIQFWIAPRTETSQPLWKPVPVLDHPCKVVLFPNQNFFCFNKPGEGNKSLLLPYALLERPHEAPTDFAYCIRLYLTSFHLVLFAFPCLLHIANLDTAPPAPTMPQFWDRDANGNTSWCQSCLPVKDFRALQAWLQGHSLRLEILTVLNPFPKGAGTSYKISCLLCRLYWEFSRNLAVVWLASRFTHYTQLYVKPLQTLFFHTLHLLQLNTKMMF